MRRHVAANACWAHASSPALVIRRGAAHVAVYPYVVHLTRRFRLLALCFALWQAAAVPAAAWADAMVQAGATATEAEYGRAHAERPGTYHAWVRHAGDCALCSQLAMGRDLAPPRSRLLVLTAQRVPLRPARVGHHDAWLRTPTLPRAPPSAA